MLILLLGGTLEISTSFSRWMIWLRLTWLCSLRARLLSTLALQIHDFLVQERTSSLNWGHVRREVIFLNFFIMVATSEVPHSCSCRLGLSRPNLSFQ